MDVDTLSSRSSVIDMTVNSSDDEEATKEKIIKDAENKICESSESVKAKTYLVYSRKKTWRSIVYAFYAERLTVVQKNN